MRLNLRNHRLGLGPATYRTSNSAGGGGNDNLRIVVVSLPTAEFGEAWEATWQVLGGTAPYTLTDSTFPAWVDSVALLGDIITATATDPDDVAGSPFAYDLEVTDDDATVATKDGTITVVAVVPGAPTDAVATAGDAEASIAFTAPVFTGGSAITGYRATSTPGSITATNAASPVVVTGLTNGTPYTFTVAATNVIGYGPESDASNEVTPSAFTPISATGGTESNIDVGGRMYRLHVFTTSADFIVTDLGTNPEENEYRLVASGGGGGLAVPGAGGGGAGEHKTGSLTLTVGTHAVVIPAGGAAASSDATSGSAGSTASIGALATCAGGGFGAGGSAGNSTAGGNGGCGGGGQGSSAAAGAGGTASGSGHGAGGAGFSSATTNDRAGGGGGGSSGAGVTAIANVGGNGGAGTSSSITGSALAKAGGGGGGASEAADTAGTGQAGGGDGGKIGAAGTNAAANSGSGGGGGRVLAAGGAGNGGSGYAAIRYPLDPP